MRFTDLSNKDKEYLKERYYNREEKNWEEVADELAKEFKVTPRTIRAWVNERLNIKEKDESYPEQYLKAKELKTEKEKTVFFITWGQNNTPIHKNFFKNILALKEKYNASLHVIAGRYRNPTTPYENYKTEDEFWDKALVPYLDAGRHKIHDHMTIMSDVKIRPTAVYPLSGMRGLSKEYSCIFGHPKVHLELLPTLKDKHPKGIMATGSVTLPNYSDSKAGKKAEFDHRLGFVIVEAYEDIVLFRQITADKNGDFCDYFFEVKRGEVKKLDYIEGIVFGDKHFGVEDKLIEAESLKYAKKLKAKHAVLHDVFDGYSISHHDLKDPFKQYSKEIHNKNNLKEEIEYMLSKLKPYTFFENTVIVRSNHDDFLDRWLKNEDWKKQSTYKNSSLYMRYSFFLLEEYANNPENPRGIIPLILESTYPEFKTLTRDDTYTVKGYELSMHGDLGQNGARGSIKGFKDLNFKSITAHGHSAGRLDNAVRVGTNTLLRLGYNKGASDWSHANGIIHKNGQVLLQIFTEGVFTRINC